MEMTPAYMREAAEGMADKGFSLRAHRREVDGQPDIVALAYELDRGDSESLVLECVEHPEAGARYFLEVRNFHGLRSFSFPLESWKLRDDRIEFKYYALDDTGRGLALTLVF